jgi:hypothetical protein
MSAFWTMASAVAVGLLCVLLGVLGERKFGG